MGICLQYLSFTFCLVLSYHAFSVYLVLLLFQQNLKGSYNAHSAFNLSIDLSMETCAIEMDIIKTLKFFNIALHVYE